MGKRGLAIIPLIVGSVGKNATVYSRGENYEKINFQRTTGNAALWVKSTAGDITITQQVSFDGDTWLDPVNNLGESLGTVYGGLASTTGTYIVYSPVLAPYIRFKVKENNVAATVVDLKSVLQEELN